MIGQLFAAYDYSDSIVEPISSCDINYPSLLEPLREIHAIRWHCNIKRTCQK